MIARLRSRDVPALIAIALATAVSLAWAFIVPIFQAPDEPAHFDYAMSIYGAHRLIRLSDGQRDWIVSPYTTYLLKATEFDRIARHSSMHVPPEYGTVAYFRRIDAAAPSLRDPIPPRGKINYIVGLYPFGFYALEAAWLHFVARFTPSLVTVFFAARLLCVFLTAIGLYFNYRTALNLGLERWTSVALIAAIGILPITSFVASSVQPDNLSYALVSAALFLMTELRRAGPSLLRVAILGIVLGLLAITKYQFFLCAFLPALFLLSVLMQERRQSVVQRFKFAAVFIAPAALLLFAQVFFVMRAGGHVQPGDLTGSGATGLQAAMALGPFATLWQAIELTNRAFLDCFVSGICSATFWQPGGWADTAVYIFSSAVETGIRAAISVITIVVASILVFFTAKRVLRLAAAAAHRHAVLAERVAAGDPVFNSYFCFIAFMFAFYVLTENAAGASGRHWYPFNFAAFLCFVWYAPRALSRRARTASLVLTCVLLAYAAVACGFALHDLKQRYYGPETATYVVARPLPGSVLPGSANGALWPIEEISYWANAAAPIFAYPLGMRLRVTGAAVPVGGVSQAAVMLDGETPLPVLSGLYLTGIAEATHSTANGYSGFSADISTSWLREGPHTIAAYALAGRSVYQRLLPSRIFFLTSSDGRFSSRFLHALSPAPESLGSLRIAGTCRGGATLLLQGRLKLAYGAAPYAAWLLLDDRPFPARYDAARASFVGRVPTQGIGPGRHRVSAYVVALDPRKYSRVSQDVVFSVPLDHAILPSSAQECADPLLQLQP